MSSACRDSVLTILAASIGTSGASPSTIRRAISSARSSPLGMSMPNSASRTSSLTFSDELARIKDEWESIVEAIQKGGDAVADDEYPPRHASGFPEWEIEEMIRDVIGQTMRSDIADRVLA
jgi:hypothetical protein